ncbi:MAG: Uma2 family endonuclease [Cyclobacteriaceae bacterium]
METQVDKRLITREEYYKMADSGILAFDEKVELINGEIINKMSPIGIKHASVLGRLSYLLRGISDQWYIRTQNPVVIDGISEPEPDIAVVDYKQDFYAEGHPIVTEVYFLIEISDSTLAFDKTTKKELYATGGIKEYWVVDINNEHVEVYADLVGNQYTKTKVYSESAQKIPVGTTGEFLRLGAIFPK